MANDMKARLTWRGADAVCFDVDCTLIQEEGIDEMAKYCGAGAEVKEMTKKAMGGSMTFQQALKMRLDIINITQKQLNDFIESKNPEEILTPGIPELVSLLLSRKTSVYLVSGGFRSLIEPLAEYLGIPKKNIFANRLLFEDGKYVGFDEAELTCRSGGKARVMEKLKLKHRKIVMIGDGATDMEAYPPADGFIGFGGNVVRDVVKKQAPWFAYSMQELIDELEKVPKKEALYNGMVYHQSCESSITKTQTPIVSALAAN